VASSKILLCWFFGIATTLSADSFSFSYTDGATGFVGQGQDIVIRTTITNSALSTGDLTGIFTFDDFFLISPLGGFAVDEFYLGGCQVCGFGNLDIAPGQSEILTTYEYFPAGPGQIPGFPVTDFPPVGTVFELANTTIGANFSDGGGSNFIPSQGFERTIVPEPSYLILIGMAAASIVIRRRLESLKHRHFQTS